MRFLRCLSELTRSHSRKRLIAAWASETLIFGVSVMGFDATVSKQIRRQEKILLSPSRANMDEQKSLFA